VAGGVWVTADAPLGFPAVFIRDGACREAMEAVRAMRLVDAAYPVRACISIARVRPSAHVLGSSLTAAHWGRGAVACTIHNTR
jgi:hypothetical protein